MSAARRGRPPASETLHDETIKAAARDLMRERGTAGLSLRAIARALNVTAPAIYNYFQRLDDLITALVVDAFASFGDAIVDALQDDGVKPYATRIRAGALAYRAWAVAHPVDFELIYGNPIPSYVAPAEVTVPLAARPLLALGELFAAAYRADELCLPDAYDSMPSAVDDHLRAEYGELMEGAPIALVALLASSWARMHGLVMLELFGHLEPVVGDAAAFYAHEIDALLASFGLETLES